MHNRKLETKHDSANPAKDSQRSEAKIKWLKSERFERTARFTLNASPAEIFPLLCPVREYDWLPGWKCSMVHSKSGVAEKDAIFHTREALGRKAVWTNITYEPDNFIEYLVVSGRDAMLRLSIELAATGKQSTEVHWVMLFTACSLLGRKMLQIQFSQAKFDKMMEQREQELKFYLANKKMIDTKLSANKQ
jgi:hypothetical protein